MFAGRCLLPTRFLYDIEFLNKFFGPQLRLKNPLDVRGTLVILERYYTVKGYLSKIILICFTEALSKLFQSVTLKNGKV